MHLGPVYMCVFVCTQVPEHWGMGEPGFQQNTEAKPPNPQGTGCWEWY